MAAESKDAHIVEIPVDSEHEQKKLISAISNIAEAIEDHPLTEISDSPGHLLLLKLWQREEEIFGRRIAHKELRMDSIRRELFQLSSFFFIFHFLFLTLLFTSSVNPSEQEETVDRSCRKWWIPSVVSVVTSLVFVFLVQVKLNRYWRVWREVKREREGSRGVTRCVQELRMKGASFDLSKEPAQSGGKKMKSSSVEIKWKPWSWCCRNLLTICLVCFTGLAFPASKFVLCGF